MTRCPLRRDSSTLARGAGTGLRGDSRTNYEERDGPRISANGSLGLTSGYLTLPLGESNGQNEWPTS